MLSSATQEIFYVGNASTVTTYVVPFLYLEDAHVKVDRLDVGTGTVVIVDGVVTFSSAQTLQVGSHLRISGTTYKIDSRTSSTVYGITDHTVDVSSSSFHLPDSATLLTEGSTWTLIGTSGAATLTTNPAIAATALLRVYRQVPYTQLTELASSGPIPVESIEDALDYQMMALQQIATAVTNAGIIVPSSSPTSAGTNDTTTFANTAARTAAIPTRIGQQGVQLDTGNEYYGTATTAGSWALTGTEPMRTFTSVANVSAATPRFTGEFVTCTADASGWVSYGTTAGQWNLLWGSHPDVWSRQPWAHGEILEPTGAAYRWAGNIPRQFIVERACVHVGRVGEGALSVKLHLPHTGREITVAAIALNAVTGAFVETTNLVTTVRGTFSAVGQVWEGGISASAASGASHMERVEVEIVSVGTENTLTITAGSNVSTPSGGSYGNLLTGTPVTIPNSGDVIVIASRGGGTVSLSQPANQSGAVTSIPRLERLFTIGVEGLTLVAGNKIVPVSDPEVALIRVGASVKGATILENTYVAAIDATPGAANFTLSKAVTGATAQLAVIDPDKPAIQRFTNITALSGATTVALPHIERLKLGDTVKGTNVASGTYISASPASGIITFTPALSGNISQLFVGDPERAGTALAGAVLIPLTNTVGLKVGQKVSSGAGVPENTFITNVLSPNITLSQAVSQNITAEVLTFTEETIQLTGATALGETDIILPLAVSSTPVAVGNLVTGKGVPAGTFVTSISGSTIVTNNEMQATSAAVTLTLTPHPVWTGLEVSLTGHWISSSAPR